MGGKLDSYWLLHVRKLIKFKVLLDPFSPNPQSNARDIIDLLAYYRIQNLVLCKLTRFPSLGVGAFKRKFLIPGCLVTDTK